MLRRSRSSPRPARQPAVRPWALAGPLLVLILAAPFIRPLLQPGVASDREVAALQAVQTVLRHQTLAVDPATVPASELFAGLDAPFVKDPPVYLLGLAGVAWLIEWGGVTFEESPHIVEYLLIFFAITLPTALASALLYRVGRVFELRRPLRLGLALTCVLATGWFSYCVVLLPHALAAALLVGAMTSFVQVLRSTWPKLAIGWLFPGGFCLAAAAAMEPVAIVGLILLPLTLLALPLKWGWRFNAAVVLALGMAGPIALHAAVNLQITGDLLPPRLHEADLAPLPASAMPGITPLGEDLDPVDPTVWFFLGRAINRVLIFTIGSHGLLSHFPVLLLGIVGAGIVVHRNWTRALKTLAGTALAMGLILLGHKAFARIDEVDTNFAAARLVIVAPLLMIWAGAWLRRTHSGLVWTLAGVALGLSVAISLIGATAPAPPGGYTRYTAIEAAVRLFGGTPSPAPEPPRMGRAAKLP